MTEIKREEIQKLVRDALRDANGVELLESNAYPKHLVVNSLRETVENLIEFDRDESEKKMIAEDDLKGLKQGSRVRVAEGVRFTPSASDFVRENRIELVTKTNREMGLKVSKVAIGADHGGFENKEKLKQFLARLGLGVRDFGTNSSEAVDYPDIAFAVAEAVSRGLVDIGIVIDGAGIGSAMAAGKVPGVRAAACYNVELAKNSREHNDANVLTLGAGQNTFDEMAAIIEAFISTEVTESRHKKRVGKISAIEKQFCDR